MDGLGGLDGWMGWAGGCHRKCGTACRAVDTANHTFSHSRMQTTWNHSKCNGDNVSTSRFPIDLRLYFCIPKKEEGSPVSGVASMSPREDTQAVTTAMRESYMLVTHTMDVWRSVMVQRGSTRTLSKQHRLTFLRIYFFNVLLEVVAKERFPRQCPQPPEMQPPVLKRGH